MKAQVERYLKGYGLSVEAKTRLGSEWVRRAHIYISKEGYPSTLFFIKWEKKYAIARIEMLKQADPTGDKQKYINWLIGLDIKGTSRFPEDIREILLTLTGFENLKKSKYRNKIERDINKYKTAGGLHSAIRQSVGMLMEILNLPFRGGGVLFASPRKITKIPEGSQEVYTDEKLRVIEVWKPEAGAILFKDTLWCTRDPKIFKKNYKPPFYLFLKDDFPYMLCDEHSQQLQDIHNDRISSELWDEVKPILRKLNLTFTYFRKTPGISTFETSRIKVKVKVKVNGVGNDFLAAVESLEWADRFQEVSCQR